MKTLKENDFLTQVTKYNLIRAGRMIHIDVHKQLFGRLAAPYIAVPNLVSLIAGVEYQGAGETEAEALEDCLTKIENTDFESLFPAMSENQPENRKDSCKPDEALE